MNPDDLRNEFVSKISGALRSGLSDLQAKTRDLYKIEELEEYRDISDSPIDHLLAALDPLISQASDFHDYADCITNRMQLDLEQVDIHALLDGVLTILDQLMDLNRAVQLVEEVPDNLPSIEADPARLSQALMIYLHNAVKFTEKGTITLHVEREPNAVRFEVGDTGIGIAEADQERVFEWFDTILPDTNDPRVGLGLGLKICEHIIDLHDGETWFESEATVGSTFGFTIPL